MARIHTDRKSGFIMRGGVMRRQTLWFAGPHTSNALGAAATAVLTSTLNAAALALRPFTVVRTRGQWLCTSDQSAATEFFSGSLGFSVVSDQATAIGVTALPTPATDQGSDLFFVYESWTGLFQLVGTDVQSEVTSKQYDSKAMRKVDDDQTVVITAEAGLIDQGLIVRNSFRMLVKLH